MKNLLLGAVTLMAFGVGGTGVNAADMPTLRKAEPLPVWTFAGVYFGAHAGGAWGRSEWTSDFPCDFIPGTSIFALCDPVNQKPGGWVVGGQTGMRWQWSSWVFGLEGTLAASRIIANDPSTCTGPLCIPAVVATLHYETLISTLYSGTAQLGYAFNRTLWYVKGGWAGGEIRRNGVQVIPVPAAAIFSTGETRQAQGWTVGTGFEYLVLQNLSLGVEYDYFRLRGSSFSTCLLPGPLACNLNATDVRADVHQVLARANYRLDWNVLFRPDAEVVVRN
jgi:outer membrane immunogenic protein